MSFFLFIVLSSQFSFGAECPEGTFKRSAHPRKSYYRADGTFVSATNVSEGCVPKRPGHDFWIPRFKNGLPPAWPHKEKTTKWTEEQRLRVLEALSEIPEVLWMPSIKGIYRLSRSKDHPNPAANADGMIVLYDNVFDEEQNLARILAHELAHETYRHLNLSKGIGYRKVTGWSQYKVGRTVYWSSRVDGYVKEDGRRYPEEDFANNLEHFLFEPETLKRITPEAFKWLKINFGDKLKLRSAQ